MIEMPDGSMRSMTFSALTWSAFDDLLDAGYSVEWLLKISRPDGWHPINAPFDLRFSSAIALAHQVHREKRGPFG